MYDLNGNDRNLLYSETSTTNIDNYNSFLVEEWGKILLTSERDGWRQLYLLDIKSKSLQRITTGSYYVKNVLRTDKKTRNIIFTATGKEPGRNPYQQHVYSITPGDKKEILLTPEDAHHEVSISTDGKYLVDNFTTLDKPTVTVLRETKSGKIIKELSKANIDGLLSMNYKFPESLEN